LNLAPEKSRKLAVVWRSVDELIPYARNARTHSPEQVAQIASSIAEFGWTNPVLTDGANGIVAGHGRVLAARKLGHTEVPTLALDGLTKAQVRAYVLADNKLALNAGWDNEMLSIELSSLRDDGFDIGVIGFSTDEIDTLGLNVSAEDISAAFGQLPDADREPFTHMTFTLHDEQATTVKAALSEAEAMGEFIGPNENSNGNALARICEAFLARAHR
jgi:hypothetical protein